MNEQLISPQQKRENEDPHENANPVPWYLLALVGLMFVFGVIYIGMSHINTPSEWGDGREVAELSGTAASAAGSVDGASIYASRCVACHQANGGGLPGVFPPLAGSEWVNGKSQTLTAILLHGVTGPLTVKGADYNGAMPGFKDQLNDAEIAAVASFIRSQWGNTGEPLAADAIAQIRKDTQSRADAFKGGAELAALQ